MPASNESESHKTRKGAQLQSMLDQMETLPPLENYVPPVATSRQIDWPPPQHKPKLVQCYRAGERGELVSSALPTVGMGPVL